jgi:hypothetical protein
VSSPEASAKGILSGDTGASGKTVTSAVTVVIDSCWIQLLLENFAFYELLKTAQHSGSSLQYIYVGHLILRTDSTDNSVTLNIKPESVFKEWQPTNQTAMR